MSGKLTEIRNPKNNSNLLIVHARELNLKDYHHNEEYNEYRKYEEYYIADYGRGLLKYKRHLFFNILTDEKYIIPIQVLSDIEKCALVSFCNCYKHTNIFLKPFSRNIGCCLMGLFMNQKNIDEIVGRYKNYYKIK